MPQTTDALRALMKRWFGDPVATHGPILFLESHGWTEEGGLFIPPVSHHNVSREELACLRFLAEEWDYSYEIGGYYPEYSDGLWPKQQKED